MMNNTRTKEQMADRIVYLERELGNPADLTAYRRQLVRCTKRDLRDRIERLHVKLLEVASRR